MPRSYQGARSLATPAPYARSASAGSARLRVTIVVTSDKAPWTASPSSAEVKGLEKKHPGSRSAPVYSRYPDAYTRPTDGRRRRSARAKEGTKAVGEHHIDDHHVKGRPRAVERAQGIRRCSYRGEHVPLLVE